MQKKANTAAFREKFRIRKLCFLCVFHFTPVFMHLNSAALSEMYASSYTFIMHLDVHLFMVLETIYSVISLCESTAKHLVNITFAV